MAPMVALLSDPAPVWHGEHSAVMCKVVYTLIEYSQLVAPDFGGLFKIHVSFDDCSFFAALV